MNNSLQPNKAVREHSAPYSTAHVVYLSVFSKHRVSIIVPGLQRLNAFQPRTFLENLFLGYEWGRGFTAGVGPESPSWDAVN